LYREAELVQQPRDVVVVIANPESLLDQVADHRSGPHPALVARRKWAGLDDGRQLRALLFRELRRRPRGNPGHEPLDPERLVPLEPAIHRAPRHSDFRREVDHAPVFQVAKDCAASPPTVQVPTFLRSIDKPPQLLERRRRASRRADRFSRFRPCQDHLRSDRGTLILEGSDVNRMDRGLRDPV
jgi:hypothetical protein